MPEEKPGTPSNQTPPKGLTVGQVAALFKVTTQTVIRWESEGRLKSYRTLGNHRRFSETEVLPLIAPKWRPPKYLTFEYLTGEYQYRDEPMRNICNHCQKLYEEKNEDHGHGEEPS